MPTVNEALRDDAIAHAVDMQHYSANVLRRIIALLNRTDADIAAQIAAALDAGPPGASVQRLDALLDSVRGLNAQAYAAVSDALQREVQSLAGYEAERQIEAWRSALDAAGAPVVVGAQAGATIAIALTAVPPATAYAAAMSRPFQGRLLSEWMQTLESDRAARIRDTVRMGYLEGQTTDQIVRRVRGTRAGKYADGILQIDRRNAEAVVRTALSHTAATARSLVTEANADLISDLVWAATLDTRTSEICRPRDGKRYTVDAKHKPIGHDLPWLGGPGRAHWNCRSVEVHTIKAWDELGITMPPATRASMDGQVPAETTYAEWLARQPMDRIEDVLGPTRAKLFASGGLPLDRFSARDGHYLTLDELRKRDAEAFKRAGLAA